MLAVGSMKVYTKIQKDQDTKMDEVFFFVSNLNSQTLIVDSC